MNMISQNNGINNPLEKLRIRRGDSSLARKILAPTLFIIALMIVGFYVYSFLNARAEKQARESEDSQQAEKIFISEINRLGDFSLGLAIEAANNPEIQAAFAARDRVKLMQLTLDGYLALDETFNIPQYQYHLPPATSFLRLHSTDKFGDDLSSFRFTVIQVNESQQPVVGLEVGRGGLGLRGIEPVFYEGNHIGSVEFGLNIDQELVANLKEEYGNDWRIVLTRNALSLATLEDIAALQEGPSADLLVLASTIDDVFPDPEIYSRALDGERKIAQVSGAQNRKYSVTTIPLHDYSGRIIGTVDIIFDRTSIIQAQNNRLITIFLAGLAALALGAFSLIFSTNRSLRPLEKLTKAAEAIQKGDLNHQVTITDLDEIGRLGQTFNAMTSQLRELFGQLEQRVADRTKALSSVAEVSTAASTILETNKLLQQVVDLAKERFNLYHAHIYLLNEAEDTLVLASGAGEPGRQMVAEGRSIPLDREQSLVARAAREKRGVTVNDVTQAPDFLPNPLLPDTHSELAVPMMIGEQVIGVFDVQSEVIGRFTDADIAVQTTLASQIASAVQNARLYTRAETAAQEARSLVENASEGIAILDLETELWAEPNENFAKVFGMTREEIAITGPKVMSPPKQPDGRDSIEKAIEMINTAMEKGSHRFEWVHLTKQGTEFDCEIGLVRMPGDRPRLRQSLLDITERKRLQELTTQRARQQEAINTITQRIQSTTTIEEAMQVAARELGHALGKRQTLVALDPSALSSGDRTEVTTEAAE